MSWRAGHWARSAAGWSPWSPSPELRAVRRAGIVAGERRLKMKEPLDRLRLILETVPPRLLAIEDADAARPVASEKWSRKEVLGHLVDSASNNHQRFVRGQLAPELHFPPYEQEGWVAVQRYRSEPWDAIVDLWRAYNRHLLHVMAAVSESPFAQRVHSRR